MKAIVRIDGVDTIHEITRETYIMGFIEVRYAIPVPFGSKGDSEEVSYNQPVSKRVWHYGDTKDGMPVFE